MEVIKSCSLVVIVIGASGDLAKKKTYPSLLNLFCDRLLPNSIRIFGVARSKLDDNDLRGRLRPFLQKVEGRSDEEISRFLECCFYHPSPSYGDIDAYSELSQHIESFEKDTTLKKCNRLFYFAIPPSVFRDSGLAIKQTCMQDESTGWTRLIVEKPFGRDLKSFEEINKTLSEHFTENQLYRIDHYLGKELVQNLQVLRFSNFWFERVWNSECIQCVILTFKEPFGTQGRGGYFDQVRA